jgi:hypothetical protein
MTGIEKRVARFPQFYSRIGFVHEFRPLDAATQMQELLEKKWTLAGVTLGRTTGTGSDSWPHSDDRWKPQNPEPFWTPRSTPDDAKTNPKTLRQIVLKSDPQSSENATAMAVSLEDLAQTSHAVYPQLKFGPLYVNFVK